MGRGTCPPTSATSAQWWRRAGGDASWRSPALASESSLVLVSLGTTPMGEEILLQRILDALADAPVHVVANCGRHINRTSLRPPVNAALEGYIRHAAILPFASLLVTHAGLGSVAAALAYGVPMVCMPLGREQPQNAAAVERLGAGRVVSKNATDQELRTAILETLSDPVCHKAARDMSHRIRSDGAFCTAELEVMVKDAKGLTG
jgi:MGT family glycosyltransferase